MVMFTMAIEKATVTEFTTTMILSTVTAAAKVKDTNTVMAIDDHEIRYVMNRVLTC